VRRFIMRRFGLLLTLMSVMFVGALALPTQPRAMAQEATPAPGEGVTFEALASAPGIPLPATGDLSIARISFAPGTVFPIFADDLTYGLAVIESGELTIRPGRPLVITRAGAPGSAATEEIAAGQEVTVRAGDTVLFPPYGGGELRNDGQEITVVLAAFVGEAVTGTPVAETPTA
jgi:hypothetical protein